MNPPPNNCPPLCGTHTDAEFEQLQSQLAEAVTTHNENCPTTAAFVSAAERLT